MTASLEAAVDELYAAFAGRHRPQRIEYCTHCVRPEDVEPLLKPVPLRELPVRALGFYASRLFNTVGGAADFHYFAPRILHIAATVGFDYPDLDHVLARLRRAGWRDWPEREQRAVAGLVRALWSRTLARPPADLDAEQVLHAILEIEDDLSPYLDEWEASLTELAAATHLFHLLRDGSRDDVAAWLASPRLTATVTAAADAVTDDETVEVLLEILIRL